MKPAIKKFGKSHNKDLCMTCLNAGNCIYQKEKSDSVMFCEEFICEKPISSPNITQPTAKTHEISTGNLCDNCRKRKSCIFRKKNGKIQYCEEYEY
jgi:hypothetical protein